MRRLALYIAALVLTGQAAAQATRRNVAIEWDEVEGATAYEVRVTPQDHPGPALTFRLNRPRWSANIRAGLYQMQLRTFDDRGVPGGWSPPTPLTVNLPAVTPQSPGDHAVVRGREVDEDAALLAWDPVPGAHHYRVVIESENFRREVNANQPKLEVRLSVARDYAWTVTGVDEKGREGEPADAPAHFRFEGPSLPAPRVARPTSKYAEVIRWDAVPKASRYVTELSVFDPARRTWSVAANARELTSTEYALDPRRAAGRYRLRVYAAGELRPNSPASVLNFNLAGGFADERALRDARVAESLTLPGRTVVTVALRAGAVDYGLRDAATNAYTRLTGAQTVARITAARPARRGHWGATLNADVGTFGIQGKRFVYQAIDAAATYRVRTTWRDTLVFDAGLFRRELPVVIGSPVDGFSSVSRQTVQGPTVGAEYTYAVTERWGARLDARAYVGLSGGTSREVGVYGLYRRNQTFTLIGGLVKRHDEATTPATRDATSFASPGATNQINFETTLLHLAAKFSF